MKQSVFIVLLAILFGGGIYFYSSQMPEIVTESAVEKIDTVNTANFEPAQAKVISRSEAFSLQDVSHLLAYTDEAQRQQVLSSPELFQQLFERELTRLALIDAALQNGLDKNEKIKYLMARQADELLLNTFANARLRTAGVPDGFPSEEQLRKLYEDNKESFTLPEQLPVWQIFWPVTGEISEAEEKKLLESVKKISYRIRTNKADFFEMAMKHSEHEPSRQRGGFMGVLRVADIRPDIKDDLLALKPNHASQPIRGEVGLHILQRGVKIPARQQSFDEVRERVKSMAIELFLKAQRIKLNQLARKQFPAKISLDEAEKWRQGQISGSPQ